MNSDTKPTTPEKPGKQSAATIALDDDLEDEALGVRQDDACKLEEGCETCQ